MKTTLFTAGQVMACLMMLLSPGAFAEEYHKDVTVTFNLKAKYEGVTCEPGLIISGNSSASNIDFGTFSSDSVKKEMSVVLALKCDSALPKTVKVGFSVMSPATVDINNKNQLYPSDPDVNEQNNLYYDWVWGDAINNTVKQSASDGTHKALQPNGSVDLRGASGDVYEVVSEGRASNVLEFPLKITRRVKDVDKLAAGDYAANVTVTVSYD